MCFFKLCTHTGICSTDVWYKSLQLMDGTEEKKITNDLNYASRMHTLWVGTYKKILPTNALNLVLCPARVCFWTGMIFKTSSLREDPMKKSMISNSYVARKKEKTLQYSPK